MGAPALALPIRPLPPPRLRMASSLPLFVPDLALGEFVREHFISPSGIFYAPEWQPLEKASIGFVWTNAADRRGGRVTAGMAELIRFPTKPQWKEAARIAQIVAWFGTVVDFLITLHGPYSTRANDASFYALLDHEVSHCDQAKDRWGAPKWSKTTGLPCWRIKGHDVEQHVGTVRRWGVDATDTRALVEAAHARPRLLELVGGPVEPLPCGLCERKAA